MVLGSQVLLRNVSEHQLADFLPRANLSTTPFSMSISQKESLNLICHDKNCLLWFCLYLQHLLLGFAFWFGRPCRPLVRSIFEGSSSLSFWSFFDLRTKVVMDLNISSTLMLSLAEVSKSWIPIWSANLRASSVRTTCKVAVASLSWRKKASFQNLSVRVVILVAHQNSVDDVTVGIDLMEPPRQIYIMKPPEHLDLNTYLYIWLYQLRWRGWDLPFDVSKALSWADVIDNNHAMSSTIVCWCDCAEPLLQDIKIFPFHFLLTLLSSFLFAKNFPTCPAVSQIWSFTRSPLISIVRILKSTPAVNANFKITKYKEIKGYLVFKLHL